MKERLPHVNVGTVGHVDHGKTTLTAAITKVAAEVYRRRQQLTLQILIMLQKKEKEELQLLLLMLSMFQTARHYAHVDCPGHADYVKNMITGAAQMDGAILSCKCCRWPNASD